MVPDVEEGCARIEASRLMEGAEKDCRGRQRHGLPPGFTVENRCRQTKTNRGIHKTDH